mmetsp:Transcript_15952/g.55652  ORF Transcript_15952/g.55652 Transcript_15952/m.55652 type:complete len:275 (-) Transcript_15952:6-830(-)
MQKRQKTMVPTIASHWMNESLSGVGSHSRSSHATTSCTSTTYAHQIGTPGGVTATVRLRRATPVPQCPSQRPQSLQAAAVHAAAWHTYCLLRTTSHESRSTSSVLHGSGGRPSNSKDSSRLPPRPALPVDVTGPHRAAASQLMAVSLSRYSDAHSSVTRNRFCVDLVCAAAGDAACANTSTTAATSTTHCTSMPTRGCLRGAVTPGAPRLAVTGMESATAACRSRFDGGQPLVGRCRGATTTCLRLSQHCTTPSHCREARPGVGVATEGCEERS